MCLKYMEKVRDRQNFRFCAIPQVMAVGTLASCYNNHKVFTGMPASLHTAVQHNIGHIYFKLVLVVCLCLSQTRTIHEGCLVLRRSMLSP